MNYIETPLWLRKVRAWQQIGPSAIVGRPSRRDTYKSFKMPSTNGKVGVLVATFGSPQWKRQGISAALESEQDDPNTKIIPFHWEGGDLSLGAVRNAAARSLVINHKWDCEWLIFLDADDRLPPDYVTKMRGGWGDLRQPLTVELGSEEEPSRIPRIPLIRGNYIVIGAMVKADLFWKMGGFSDYPCLEDWELWLRLLCYANATIGESDAVYHVAVRSGSRNDSQAHARFYRKIRSQYTHVFLTREKQS